MQPKLTKRNASANAEASTTEKKTPAFLKKIDSWNIASTRKKHENSDRLTS
jgi:hypothetical protein